MWAPSRPDLSTVHGSVFAGDVRQRLLGFLECDDFRASSLSAAPGCNCSVVLSDADCTPIVVRKHPRSFKTGQLLPVTEFPAGTLWGVDHSAGPWQPYVLWEADLKTQVLRHAWLAAVFGIDDPQGAVIYSRYDLPPAVSPAHKPSAPDESQNDGWDEEFSAGEGEAPIDSA